MDYRSVLQSAYSQAVRGGNSYLSIPADIRQALDIVAGQSENSKGVFTVLVTSLVHKIMEPNQDVRLHQRQIPGGYSGRHVDKKFVTPFLKDVKFPAMGESGWLTRSLEQPHPFDLSFPGNIRGQGLKPAFLSVLNAVEELGQEPGQLLLYLFERVHDLVETNRVEINRGFDSDVWLRRADLLAMFENHFTSSYTATHGAARLPVLAIAACLSQGSTLRKLGSHTSPDYRSGALGDIETEDQEGNVRLAIEVKHDIQMTREIVRTSAEKTQGRSLEQLHIVTSVESPASLKIAYEAFARDFFYSSGCDITVFSTREYIHNLLTFCNSPEKVLEHYADYLESDPVVQAVHKLRWNEILEQHNGST